MDCPADWLIRSRHNRSLPNGQKLWDDVTGGEALGKICFVMPSRHDQKAREVRQKIWLKRVMLPSGRAEPVGVACLIAREENPPKGCKAVEW